jgi:UDP-N-acetylglucosamine acyltransferase
MGSVLLQDVPPYVTAAGNPAAPHGINSEGLKRRGFSSAAVMAIKRAYKTLYKSGLMLEQAKVAIEEQAVEYPDLNALVDFLGRSQRGVIR